MVALATGLFLIVGGGVDTPVHRADAAWSAVPTAIDGAERQAIEDACATAISDEYRSSKPLGDPADSFEDTGQLTTRAVDVRGGAALAMLTSEQSDGPVVWGCFLHREGDLWIVQGMEAGPLGDSPTGVGAWILMGDLTLGSEFASGIGIVDANVTRLVVQTPDFGVEATVEDGYFTLFLPMDLVTESRDATAYDSVGNVVWEGQLWGGAPDQVEKQGADRGSPSPCRRCRGEQ